MRLVNESTVAKLSLAVARTACAVFPFAGCGNSDLIDQIGSETLGDSLDKFFPSLRCVTRLCEGKKDCAPSLIEGSCYGSRLPLDSAADLVADPVEGTGQLARPAGKRNRSSCCAAVLAPIGTVAKLYSGCYAHKLVLPPGAPTDLSLEDSPSQIVERLASAFQCEREKINVWLLERDRNLAAITAFKEAGTTVHLIEAGDLEAHLLAGCAVRGTGPLHVSYGIGGLPEGILAVPFLRRSGAPLRLKPCPLGRQEEEILAANCQDMLGREFSASDLIASDDCIVALAGITSGRHAKHSLIKGIRLWDESAPCVTVLVASPAFRDCRELAITFEEHSLSQGPPAIAQHRTETAQHRALTDSAHACLLQRVGE
jgi:fructose-1,6-bisphosphatase/sedoheptulose 1,7-bisphosphatase-like protein